jgi:glycosyltransferase involved in cell wall biosynthesis
MAIIFSIITPTLNAQRTLEECLQYLTNQNYPRENYEIIIPDGGSKDRTRDIAQKYGAIVIENPLKTGEAGKMAGIKIAKGKYIVLLDSDNILIDPDWLHKMQKPLDEDQEIMASEPLRYDSRPTDHPLARYFAYLGMSDPLNLFIGNYDRYSYITNKWTGLVINTQQQIGYIKLILELGNIPTIGANGFVIRKTVIEPFLNLDYYFDTDIFYEIYNKFGTKKFVVAKVETGVVHLYVDSFTKFARKQKRRVKDYLFYRKSEVRTSSNISYISLIRFIFFTIMIIPLLFQAFIGYIRKPDWVWVFHPISCVITLYVYSVESVKSIFISRIESRDRWSQ